MIELSGVSKYYGTFQAIHDMSFSVKPGEITGLLGPNGAGKTTVMKIITCYHNAHAGEVRVCGIDVLEDPVGAKRRIGYLPENNAMYEDLFVYEYLRFVGESRNLSGDALAKAIRRVTELCALESFVYKPIASLSKGMKQRVGLAQAIIHDPDVVILDEPTSGLDPNQIKDIRAVIRELGKTKTVILSTHILQEVEILCSRILIVNGGTIVAEGTNAEIAAKMKGEETYEISVAASPKKKTQDIIRAFSALQGVSSVQEQQLAQGLTQDGAGGETHFVLFGASGRLSGEAVFDCAVANGLRLSSLNKKSARLENLFESITAGPQGSANGLGKKDS